MNLATCSQNVQQTLYINENQNQYPIDLRT